MRRNEPPAFASQAGLGDLLIGIDHVGICVDQMSTHTTVWTDLLGLPVSHHETVGIQKTEAVFFDPPDRAATVELVCPMPGNAGLEKFLEKRKSGLHHLAFAVTDIHAALARLEAAGVPLVDRTARQGARGHLVAFLHPRAAGGTLVELVQRGGHSTEHK